VVFWFSPNQKVASIAALLSQAVSKEGCLKLPQSRSYRDFEIDFWLEYKAVWNSLYHLIYA